MNCLLRYIKNTQKKQFILGHPVNITYVEGANDYNIKLMFLESKKCSGRDTKQIESL